MAGGRARNLGGEVGSDEVGSDEPENLIDEMMAASRVFVAIVARSLAELAPDLTLPQYRVLVVLATEGSQNMNGLAAALGVTPSTASRLCERLVQRKMVSRRTSRTDRREVRLSITDHAARPPRGCRPGVEPGRAAGRPAGDQRQGGPWLALTRRLWSGARRCGGTRY
jgi:DNA-binding MarR family transcriptional regulator